MASVVVDSVLVEAGWDPSALERGLARSDRLVQDFIGRTGDVRLTPTLTLNIRPALAEADALNARVGAVRKAIEQPLVVAPLRTTTPIVPPTIIPPIVVPLPDFSKTIAEAERAAAVVRGEFETALRGSFAVMGNDAFQAGIVAAKELQTGLVGQIQGIGKQVAAGLISIPEATARIDAAIQAMSLEARRLQGTIPPIQIRTVVMPAGARGVTTGASPSVIPTAELNAAEEAFDRLQGVTEATNQSFVKVGSSSSKMAVGIRGAASNLSILAAQSVGATGAVGTLAQNVLLFSSGIPAVAAAAGTVLGVSLIFQAITAEARKAKQATDDAIASLLKLHDAQRDPVRVRLEETGEAAKRLEEIRQKIVALTTEQRTLESKPLVFSDRGGDQTAARLTFIHGRLVQLGHDFATTAQAAAAGGLDVAAEQAKQLAEALQLGTASGADIQQAIDRVTTLNAAIRTGIADLNDRNAKQREANALIESLQSAPIRQASLDRRALEETISAVTGAAKAQAQVAAAPGFDALIAKYRALEAAAAGDTAQIQKLADTRHDIVQLAKATDDALKAFANIGGLSKAPPVLEFKATLAFVSPIEAIVDVVTGRADARIRANLDKILAELKQRSDAAFSADLGNIPLPDNTIPAGFDRAKESVEGVNDALIEAAASADAFFRKANKAAGGVTEAARKAAKAQQELVDAIHDVTSGIDAVVAGAQSLNVLGDQAAAQIGSVLDLADAFAGLKDAAGNLTLGGVLGVAGAALGVLGAVLGPSESELERNRILAENNELLRRNNAELAVRQGGIGGLSGLGKTLAELQGVGDLIQRIQRSALPADLPAGRAKVDISSKEREELTRILAEAGTNVRDFADQIKAATGIDILDSKARVVAEAFEQAQKAIDDMVKAATQFGTTTSDRQRVIEARDALGLGPNVGLPPDVAALSRTREVELGGLVLDPALEAKINALDLQTEAGRQAFLEFQKMLFTLAQEGQLTAEQLGTFDSVTELLGPITDAANGLDAFKDATAAAAKNLGDLSLPQGFRRQAIAFETGDVGPSIDLAARTAAVAAMFPATIPAIVPAVPEIQPLPDDIQALLDKIATTTPPDQLKELAAQSSALQQLITLFGGQPETTGGGVSFAADSRTAPGSLFMAPPQGQTTITFEGGINITIQNGNQKDAKQIAQETVAEFRRFAMAQSGDTLQLGFT